MKKSIKITLAYFFCVVFAYAGIWFAFVADVSEPLSQGGLSVLAAISFCIAILFAGYGNSLWKSEKK